MWKLDRHITLRELSVYTLFCFKYIKKKYIKYIKIKTDTKIQFPDALSCVCVCARLYFAFAFCCCYCRCFVLFLY